MNKHTLDLRHLIRKCPDCSRRFSNVAVFCPFDGVPLIDAERPDDSLDPLIGQTVDNRYAIESVVGEGGMGTVYSARHVTLSRTMAVKVLRADLARETELAARFVQEAQATAAIKHPNIVSISDYGRLPDLRPYYVMELLKGRTLASVIKGGVPLPPRMAARIAMAIAEGLEAAHEAGVIHRDLKPENVFLLDAEAREVRIVDFGAALIVGASRLTRQGVVFGTPHYMSPEQAAGKSVDHRVDIYALGVILYEMITGRVPFEGDTYMGVLTQHMFATPKPPSEVSPELDGKLGPIEAVVLRALEKDPNARYATMQEVASAIAAALESGLLGPASTPRRSRPAPQSNAAELPTLVDIRERVSHVEGLDRQRGVRMVVFAAAAVVLALGAFIVGTRLHAASEIHEDAGAVVSTVEAGAPVVAATTSTPVTPPPVASVTATDRAPPPPTKTVFHPPPTATPKPTQSARPATNSLGPDPFDPH